MESNSVLRIQRFHEAEARQWGFHAIHRDSVWIFKITESVQCKCRVKNHEFNSQWISLTKDGTITVHADKSRPYAWDGCSPKFVIGKKQFIFGTPDGYRDYRMELPLTWIASLVHDAFYQYLHVIPLKKAEVDKIFRDLLKTAGFKFWPIYYYLVRLFGGHFIKQIGLKGVYYEKYRPVFLKKQVVDRN